jgi:hypothetical protein
MLKMVNNSRMVKFEKWKVPFLCFSSNIIGGDQIEEDEVSRACSTHQGDGKCKWKFFEKT